MSKTDGGCSWTGIDVGAPCGNMVINMGADTTEISVISLGGIVRSRLVKQEAVRSTSG